MAKILILGLGNPILGDDQVGVRVAERIKEKRIEGVDVKMAERGGLEVLDMVLGYKKLILVDAIISEREGEVVILHEEDFKDTFYASSPHGVNVFTAFSMGKALNLPVPDDIVIYGVCIKEPCFSESMSPRIAALVPQLSERIIKEQICMNLV